MKQKFKGTILTQRKCVNNILKVYNSSLSESISNDWYLDAHNFALKQSKLHNVPLIKVCGIIASLSPLKSWTENKIIVGLFLSSGKGKHTKAMVNKAKQILNCEPDAECIANILNGNKIISFFFNIYNPQQGNFVTIDRHALSVCLYKSISDNEGKGITLKQYEFFVNCYRVAGAKIGISPVKMQAVTWEIWREQKNAKDEVPF